MPQNPSDVDKWIANAASSAWQAIKKDTLDKGQGGQSAAYKPNSWVPGTDNAGRPKTAQNTELMAKGFAPPSNAPSTPKNRMENNGRLLGPVDNTELMAKGYGIGTNEPNRQAVLPAAGTNIGNQGPTNFIYRDGNSFSNIPGSPGNVYTPRAGLSVIPVGNGGESSSDYVNRMNQATETYRQMNESRNGGASNYVSDAIRELLDRSRPSDGPNGFGLLDYSPQGRLDKFARSAAARTGTPREQAQLAKAMKPYLEALEIQRKYDPTAENLNSLTGLQGSMLNNDFHQQQLADRQNQFEQGLQFKQDNASNMMDLRLQQLEGQNQYRQGLLGLGQERNDQAANRFNQLPPAFINAFAQDPTYMGNPEGALMAASEAYSRMTGGNQLPTPPDAGRQKLPRINSPEDVKKYPKGTKVILPDGSTGTL